VYATGELAIVSGVFINYRGDDSHSYAALLHLELSRRFGADLTFLDTESIPGGADFPAELISRVRQAGVVLAVIGTRWLGITGPGGGRRIDDPTDWIRRELVAAFAAGVRVIPVLTDGAEMPTEAELPGELALLARCQFRRLRYREASSDLARLAQELAALDPSLAAAASRSADRGGRPEPEHPAGPAWRHAGGGRDAARARRRSLVVMGLLAASGASGISLQHSSLVNPMSWAMIATAATVGSLSTYWSLLDRSEKTDPDDLAAWEELLTRRVRARWVTGRPQHPAALPAIFGSTIPPTLVTRPDAVAPAGLKTLVERLPRRLPRGYRVEQAFDDFGSALLILGAAGSGKTTLLIRLLEALLARGARSDPVPVLVNLATWPERRAPLDQWLVERLVCDYNVPRKAGRSLLAAGAVVAILDGLDEVPPNLRPACIGAVNRYRRRYPTNGLAVASRTAEYLQAGRLLQLPGAVEIQPLEHWEVRGYLRGAEHDLAGLRAGLDSDPDLYTLLSTPLLLTMAALAYQGRSPREIRLCGDLAQRREALVEEYLNQALRHWAGIPPPRVPDCVRALGWLAHSLTAAGHQVLYPLWMQPTLTAPHTPARRVVLLAAGAAGAGGLLLSAALGAVLANLPREVPVNLPRPILYVLSVIFVTGCTVAAGYSTEFAPAVRVRWSFRVFRQGAGKAGQLAIAGGALAAVVFEPTGGWTSAAAGGSIFGSILGLAVLVRTGLRTLHSLETTDGRRLPGRQLFALSVRYGFAIGILVGAAYAVVATHYFGPLTGLGQGLTIALAFTAFTAYFLWLASGGRAYIQHAVLCAVLYRHKLVPLRLERFLTTMVKATVLKPDSGGYAFVHHLVHSHLANQHARATTARHPAA
jgi:hypothetical protein